MLYKLIEVALIKHYYNKIEILYIDGFKRCKFPIFVGIMIDYKEQVFIIDIKADI